MSGARRFLLVATVLAACSSPRQGASDRHESASSPPAQSVPLPSGAQAATPGSDSAATVAADTAHERVAIVRLEREARALAHTTGCTRADQCRVAPVGVMACGGPRDYIAYCTASTDTVALMRTLRELERVERAYNEHAGLFSTCMMRPRPTATFVAGSCHASSVAAAPGPQ